MLSELMAEEPPAVGLPFVTQHISASRSSPLGAGHSFLLTESGFVVFEIPISNWKLELGTNAGFGLGRMTIESKGSEPYSFCCCTCFFDIPLLESGRTIGEA